MKSGLHIVLFFLLLMGVSILFGDDAPIRLTGRILDIPENWSFRYDPPEVLLRVLIAPDSTLSLISVLDGKNELIPLLDEHFATYKYLLQTEITSTPQLFDVVLELNQALETPAEQVQTKVLLADIEHWISARKSQYSLREPAPGSLSPYRAGFLTYAYSQDATPLSLDNFEQMHSYLGSAVYESNFSLFHGLKDTGTAREYGDLRYPYAVTVTDLQVGMGDYEHRFARGSLKKNDLFGIKELYLDFDFLAQGGFWLEQNSSRSALKGFLSVPLGSSTLELEYADYSGELAMIQMRPEYWQIASYSIDHSYRQYRALWKWWFNLALLGSNETLRSDAFSRTLRDDMLRLQAFDQVDIGDLHIVGLYEYNFLDSARELNHGAFTQLARMDFQYSASKLDAAATVKWFDFEHWSVDAALNLNLGSFAIGPFARLNLDAADPQTQIPSIFAPAAYLYRHDIREENAYGLSGQYLKDEKALAKLTVGRKSITNTTDVPLPPRIQVSRTTDAYYAQVSADIALTKSKWTLAWQPQITLQTVAENQLEAPALEYQSYLNLSRDLGYGNALFAGFSLNGHSSYTVASNNGFEASTSALADIWAGVQISSRFEVMVSYKNITDGFLWGAYPLPRSLHATLRWFYLN